MNGVARLLLATVLIAVLSPQAVHAQRKPSNNMWTRSAALYMDRARDNPRPEDRRALYQQALEAALEGIVQDPENPRVHFMAGLAYIRLGDYIRADSALDQAEALYAEYEEVERERNNAWVTAYNAGVTSIQQGDVDAAIGHLERADAIYQGRPGARLNLGSLYARKGDTDRAIEAYRAALEVLRGPGREGLRPQEAEQWASNEEVAAFNLAQLLAGAGRDEEAAQAYRDYLGREPDNLTAKINLAVVLARQDKAAEASELYTELLGRTDLKASELFQIGVGLFRAEEYERAAVAFNRSLELNPHSRDALYNLAQALYARSTALEEARATATGDEEKRLATELAARFDELRQVAEKLNAIDPYTRNGILLAARAHRGLGDLAADEAASDEWKAKALALLERHQDLPFEVADVNLTAGEGNAMVKGRIENLKLEEGAPVKLRFTLVGADGTVLGSGEVTVAAPPAQEVVPFEVEVATNGEVAGWKYEVAP